MACKPDGKATPSGWKRVAQDTAPTLALKWPNLLPTVQLARKAHHNNSFKHPNPCASGIAVQRQKLSLKQQFRVGYINLQGMGNSGTEGIDGGKTDEIIHLMREEKLDILAL